MKSIAIARPSFAPPSAANWIGMMANLHFHRYGTTREQLAWIALNAKYPDKLPNGRDAWDQRTLEMAIQATPGVRFAELPDEYDWIPGITARQRPGLNPVIVMTRGAYRLKAQIDEQPGDPSPWVVFPSVSVERAARCCPRRTHLPRHRPPGSRRRRSRKAIRPRSTRPAYPSISISTSARNATPSSGRRSASRLAGTPRR
jgi:hypothetical protein